MRSTPSASSEQPPSASPTNRAKQHDITIKGAPQDVGWGTKVDLEPAGGLEALLYKSRHPIAI